MQRADVDLDALPVSLLFDRVIQAKSRIDIARFAKIYASHEHFHNDRELIHLMESRFDEVTQDIGKKNWAQFCLAILLKKDYSMLAHFDERIQGLASKCELVPGFRFGALQMKDLVKTKQEEYKLTHFVKTLLDNPDLLRKGVLAHGWFFDTHAFIKTLMQEGAFTRSEPLKVAEALFILNNVQPDLFVCDWMRKITRKVITIADESTGEKLYSILLDVLPYPSPRSKSKYNTPRRLDSEISFSNTFKAFMDKKEVDPPFQAFASDLAEKSKELFLSCTLSSFNRLDFSKAKCGAIADITHEFNQLSEFAKEMITKTTGKKMKARAITFFIMLACESYKRSDHHSTFSILSALDSSAVSYPVEVWDKVDINLKDKKQHMLDTFSPLSNYKNLRSFINTYEKLDKPFTPFLGPYLTELTFAHEGNPDTKDNLINFEKVKLIGGLLERVFQQQSKLTLEKQYQSDILNVLQALRSDGTS